MLGPTPNGGPPGRAALRVAGLDTGRQALLLDLLAGLARAQEPEAVWTELAGRLKWLLDFERCVPLSLYTLPGGVSRVCGWPLPPQRDATRPKEELRVLG